MRAPASREKPPLGVKCPANNLLGRRSPLSMLEILEGGKRWAFSLFVTAIQSSFSLGNTGLWPEILITVFTGNLTYRL